MSRTKPAEQRRAELLAAGRALFVAKGIAATSLEDITTGAGVSKGLFYLYFRSKEDLVLALQEQFSSLLAERVRAAADAQPDWAGKLDACVEARFECYRDLRELHDVLFHHAGTDHQAGPDHQPSTEPSEKPLVQALRELLEDGIAAGAYHLEDPATTAVIFYTIMYAFDHDIYGSQPPAEARLVRTTQQLFRRAAGVAEPPSPPTAGSAPR